MSKSSLQDVDMLITAARACVRACVRTCVEGAEGEGVTIIFLDELEAVHVVPFVCTVSKASLPIFRPAPLVQGNLGERCAFLLWSQPRQPSLPFLPRY